MRAGRDVRREQGELGGHGLADYQSPSPAGEGDAGSIVDGLASGVDWRATFGGQVEGVDHVLHPQRPAVERPIGQRTGCLSEFLVWVPVHPGPYHGLPFRQRCQVRFELVH